MNSDKGGTGLLGKNDNGKIPPMTAVTCKRPSNSLRRQRSPKTKEEEKKSGVLLFSKEKMP